MYFKKQMKLDLTWRNTSPAKCYLKTLDCGLQSLTVSQDKCAGRNQGEAVSEAAEKLVL